MRVNVCRRREVTVTEPFLYLLYGNSVCQKQRGTAVSKIMKTDVSQSICFEQLRKAFGDIARLDDIADLVDTYILKIVLDIAASAQAAVFLLLFLQGQKSFPHKRNERQRPQTRFGLCGIGCYKDPFAVKITGSDCVTDRDSILVKVNGIPFQADCFTPAQTVECTKENRQLKFTSP